MCSRSLTRTTPVSVSLKIADSLEINEVFDMFQQNGININEETLKKLFSIVDKQNRGALDMDGF